MIDLIQLTVPYPPLANRYWRIWRNRVIVSREARDYKVAVGELVKQADRRPIDGPVVVELQVYRPRRAGDLDNAIKVLVDSLKGICWHDDSQVVAIHAYRHDDKDRPRVEVLAAAAAPIEPLLAAAARAHSNNGRANR